MAEHVHKIGFSEMFSQCSGGRGNMGVEACSSFLNKSFDKLCSRHKEMLY
jgi:hypothetical protein